MYYTEGVPKSCNGAGVYSLLMVCDDVCIKHCVQFVWICNCVGLSKLENNNIFINYMSSADTIMGWAKLKIKFYNINYMDSADTIINNMIVD